MTYLKPESVKLMRTIYRLITGLPIWAPIWMGRKRYDKEAHDVLKKNNYKMMIKYARKWLDNFEETYT